MSQPQRAVAVPKEAEEADEIFPKSKSRRRVPESRYVVCSFKWLGLSYFHLPTRRAAVVQAGGQIEEKISMHAHSRRSALRLVALAAASPFAVPMPCLAGDKVALAIKGYDPVAYFTLGKATPGLPDIEHEWDEHRYRFSRPEHRELFKAAPERYAPQFTNVCAMALALGKIVQADPESWLIVDGKLYMFGGPAGRDRFQQDLSENIVKANQNRTMLRKSQ